MNDEELMAHLRYGCNLQQRDGERAAERIAALIEERDQWIQHAKNAIWADSEELLLVKDKLDKLTKISEEIIAAINKPDMPWDLPARLVRNLEELIGIK